MTNVTKQLLEAIHIKPLEEVKQLVEQGGDKQKALVEAVSWDRYDVIEYLVEQGVNLNNSVEDVRGMLCELAECEDLEMIRYLIDKGVNIDEHHMPLLIEAVFTENLDFVKEIINLGVDVSLNNYEIISICRKCAKDIHRLFDDSSEYEPHISHIMEYFRELKRNQTC